MIPRLEPIARARELVHLPQQVDRALEEIGEIEQRARLQLAAVLGDADAKEAPHAAHERHVHVAIEAGQHFVHDGRHRRGGRAETAAARRTAPRAWVGEPLARRARARQEVRPQPIERRADTGRFQCREPVELGQVTRHQCEGSALPRSVIQYAPQRGAHPAQTFRKARHRAAACAGGGRVTRHTPEHAPQRRRHGGTPLE